MTEYLKRDIAKIIGKPIRTIQYWTDYGLVIPDIVPAQGKGKARVYSERNLIEFGMIDIISKELGLSLEEIRILLRFLHLG